MGALAAERPRSIPSSTIGRIESVGRDGRIVVLHDYQVGPVRADTLLSLDVNAPLAGAPVLLAFADDDPGRPVLVGLIGDGALDPRLGAARAVYTIDTLLVRDLDLSACNSVNIRCGRSQILMDKFGKIVIKGRDILTRASSRNRVKGGSISLN